MLNSINTLIKKMTPMLAKSRQRRGIAFHVNEDISLQDLNVFIKAQHFEKKLVISSFLDEALSANKVLIKLGEEYDLVVFDARFEFNPDALGIVSGVLCGGGFLLILLPNINVWEKDKSLFSYHMINILNDEAGVFYLRDKDSINDYMFDDVFESLKTIEYSGHYNRHYRSLDQQQAVETILNGLSKNNDNCICLTSARGRGKSSALGFVAAELLQQNNMIIYLTAPRLSVSEPVFYHLGRLNESGVRERSHYSLGNSSLHFIAPDALLEKLPKTDVLMVDEAAAIPLSMLEELLDIYPNIIFSTTTHGYEGTGRGFVLKFNQILDVKRKNIIRIEMQQPIRWSENDPLEVWLDKLLFLDLKLDEKPSLPNDLSDVEFECVDRKNLINNKSLIESLFSLLVMAHYRTKPADFQYLLDSENVRIYVLKYKHKVLGVLVINQEGEFDADLSSAIYRGERRPKGNMLAQTLCFHAGSEFAACLKYARVMRVVVHPGVRLSGLGSYLLQCVIDAEKTMGIDVIGSSFSASVPLLHFWDKADLTILRVGFSCDHVTAAHSVVMAKGLSKKGSQLVDELSEKFKRNYPLWKLAPLSMLPNELSTYIQSTNEIENMTISLVDIEDIKSFTSANRNYEACMPALRRLFSYYSIFPNSIKDEEKKIINLSLQYNHLWADIVREMGLSGKAEAISMLRLSAGQLLDAYLLTS